MRFENRTIFLAAIAVGLAANVQAAAHYRSGVILQYDLNGDEKLSAEEFLEARRSRFNGTDTNEDGQVDIDEYVYEWEGRLQERLESERKQHVDQTETRFRALNKDADDYISLAEFDASSQKGFKYFDLDNDGVIRAENDESAYVQTAANVDSESEQPKLERVSMLQMPTSHTLEGLLEIYDIDGDEQLTYEEYLSQRKEQFMRTDEDGNGLIDQQEYLLEFETRLDIQIESLYTQHIEAAYTRFGFLDGDENEAMTFKEYMVSGNRIFNHWDTTGDGYMTLSDPLPESRWESEIQDQDQDADNGQVVDQSDSSESEAIAQAD